MSADWLIGIGTVLAAVLTLFGVIYTVRKQLRSSEGKDRYDQMQEDLGRVDDKVTKLEGHVAALEAAIRVRDDYIVQLRKHIEDGNPPPPPPYPLEMRR